MKKYLIIIATSNEFECGTLKPIVCNTFNEAKETLKKAFDKAVSNFEDEFDEDNIMSVFVERDNEFSVYETEYSGSTEYGNGKYCTGKIWEVQF